MPVSNTKSVLSTSTFTPLFPLRWHSSTQPFRWKLTSIPTPAWTNSQLHGNRAPTLSWRDANNILEYCLFSSCNLCFFPVNTLMFQYFQSPADDKIVVYAWVSFQVSLSRSTLRCTYWSHQMRSGCNVRPPLVDGCWGRLSQTFWKASLSKARRRSLFTPLTSDSRWHWSFLRISW